MRKGVPCRAVPFFDHDGLRLHYSERGDPDGHPVVLIHGLLWSSRMLRRVAEMLPDHRVLLLDVRGHGASSRPTEVDRYSWSLLAGDVVGLLDHLGIERAVVGGLSLGANVALAVAAEHLDRVSGIVPEMPVLDRAEPFGRPVFRALADVLDTAAPLLDPLGELVGSVPLPASIPELAAVRDVLAVDPEPAAALVRGLLSRDLLFEHIRPEQLDIPALVIGHRGDPLHVLEDARELAARLPRARLVERWTILDYRVRPDLLAEELVSFLAEVAADA